MNTPTIPWHLLQSFAAISEAGSLNAAAAALGSSQPTLSGTVRITASQIAATYLLPPMLVDLHNTHPALNLEVVATDQTDNLLRREADVAVRMYRPTQNDLIAKKVAELPLGIFAARSYLAQHGMPVDPTDLSTHTVIGYDRSTLIIDGMRAMGMNVDRSFFAFRSDDQVVCWRMVQAGMGIGFGQMAMGAHQPDLLQLWPDMTVGSLPVWLTAHQELRMSPRVRVCFDHLAAGFAAL